MNDMQPYTWTWVNFKTVILSEKKKEMYVEYGHTYKKGKTSKNSGEWLLPERARRGWGGGGAAWGSRGTINVSLSWVVGTWLFYHYFKG